MTTEQRNNFERTRYRRGEVIAEIQTEDGDTVEESITYEAEEHEHGGYQVYATKPEVAGATDLNADVLEALYSDGLDSITNITWL